MWAPHKSSKIAAQRLGDKKPPRSHGAVNERSRHFLLSCLSSAYGDNEDDGGDGVASGGDRFIIHAPAITHGSSVYSVGLIGDAPTICFAGREVFGLNAKCASPERYERIMDEHAERVAARPSAIDRCATCAGAVCGCWVVRFGCVCVSELREMC